jgi:hypothetical protein
MARVMHVSRDFPSLAALSDNWTGMRRKRRRCMCTPDMGQRQRRGRFIRAAGSFLSVSVFPASRMIRLSGPEVGP